ncbi:MAG: T9SS type A sorting domain-containing protein, partial [Segetibacter sp.]
PDQVIVCSNLGIKVYDKPAVTDLPVVTSTGYSREQAPSTLFITLDKFFSPVLPDSSVTSDPHIRYDRLSKRWFAVAIEINRKVENNLILLAVSDGERITDSSSFTYYSFNSSLFLYNHNAPYAPFLDYPTLGIDKNSILIGGNQFGYDSLTNVGYVVDKKKLIHGQLIVYPFELGVANYRTRLAGGILTPQSVYNDDPASKRSFFAGISYNRNGIIIANIDYDKNSKPSLTNETTVQVETWRLPSSISSPGGLTPIQQLDDRLLSASIYKNKLTGNVSLWTSHAIGVNQSGRFISGSDSVFVRDARTGSRWYSIGNIYSRPSLSQVGTVFDDAQPSGRRAVQYFNPSIATSGQGHSIISGTTDAYNEYLNVFAAGRYSEDEPGKTKDPVKVTNTTAIYAPYFFQNGRRNYIGRWGDFSQTVVDPLDDQTIWTFQEYADIDDSYGVRAVQFKAPPPATPIPLEDVSNKTDNTVTVKGISNDNSGFFDPGPDQGGPGYNRLTVKSTGNIIASNVKFNSPTEITFTLNTKNKPAGKYTLIITNPDGQFVATEYRLSRNIYTNTSSNVPSITQAANEKLQQSFIKTSIAFPNPTENNVTVQMDAVKPYRGKISLLDLTGKQVFQQDYQFVKGRNEATLSLSKYSSGTYIIAILNANNLLIASHKIVKN